MRGQWAGHIARMSNTSWAKVISSGHPEKEDEQEEDLKGDGETASRKLVACSQWMRVAQDRSACSCRGALREAGANG